MHRLFVALEPPPHIRAQLLDLMGGVAGARWQSDAQLHLTLKFIGEVDRRTAEDVATTLSYLRHPCFSLSLSGVGMFDRRGRPEALWVGVSPRDSVKPLHDKVDQALRGAGIAPDGRPYAADDPHLLRWIHLAEVESFLTTYQRYGARRLSQPDADRYVAQTGLVAARLGVVEPPVSEAQLREELAGFRSELEGSPAARNVARYLLVRPPLPWPARPGYALIAAGAVATLPGWARRRLSQMEQIGTRLLSARGSTPDDPTE